MQVYSLKEQETIYSEYLDIRIGRWKNISQINKSKGHGAGRMIGLGAMQSGSRKCVHCKGAPRPAGVVGPAPTTVGRATRSVAAGRDGVSRSRYRLASPGGTQVCGQGTLPCAWPSRPQRQTRSPQDNSCCSQVKKLCEMVVFLVRFYIHSVATVFKQSRRTGSLTMINSRLLFGVPTLHLKSVCVCARVRTWRLID